MASIVQRKFSWSKEIEKKNFVSRSPPRRNATLKGIRPSLTRPFMILITFCFMLYGFLLSGIAKIPNNEGRKSIEKNAPIARQIHPTRVDSYQDILTSNNSGTNPVRDDFALSTLTGGYVWQCDGNANAKRTREETPVLSSDEHMCRALFPCLELSDYIHEPFEDIQTPWKRPTASRYPHSENYAVLTRKGYKGGPIEIQVNQDRPFILHPRQHQGSSGDFIMGIFDGHGDQYGHAVAHFLLMNLIEIIFDEEAEEDIDAEEQNELERHLEESDDNHSNKYVQQWIDLFVTMHENIPHRLSRESGSTGSIISKRGEELYISNTGDSISFIAAYEKSTAALINIVYKTREHKAHFPAERERIENWGGIIERRQIANGQMTSTRVHFPVPGGMYSLAMSRSLGDAYSKRVGVIPNPTVDVFQIQDLRGIAVNFALDGLNGEAIDVNNVEEDDVHLFAVSLSDGLFEYLEIEDIAQQLAESLEGGSKRGLYNTCQSLILQSSRAWMKQTMERDMQLYRDDISIAVHRI